MKNAFLIERTGVAGAPGLDRARCELGVRLVLLPPLALRRTFRSTLRSLVPAKNVSPDSRKQIIYFYIEFHNEKTAIRADYPLARI